MNNMYFQTVRKTRLKAYEEHKKFFISGIKPGYYRWYNIAIYYSAENLIGAYFSKAEVAVSVEQIGDLIVDHEKLSKVLSLYKRLKQIRNHSLYSGTTVPSSYADEAKASFDRIESHVNALLSA